MNLKWLWAVFAIFCVITWGLWFFNIDIRQIDFSNFKFPSLEKTEEIELIHHYNSNLFSDIDYNVSLPCADYERLIAWGGKDLADGLVKADCMEACQNKNWKYYSFRCDTTVVCICTP